MIDYKKQILITDVKMNQQCMICQVPSQEQENLKRDWSLQTHQFIKNQISRQQEEKISENDAAWVHSVDNFAWAHHLINIHTTMMIDVLHQLLKNTITYLVHWLKQLIEKSITAARKKKDIRHKISSASEATQLNHWFCSILAFAELKTFQRYSSVKQWIKADQKAIVHQIVLMVAPLLAHDAFAAVHFIWAVVNFVMLTQYISHDENTLQYLLHVLFQINKLKNVFWHLRSVNLNISEGHFNILKLHVMTHYAQHIHQYDSADNIDTEHSEAAHKFLVKVFFSQTNKHKSFQQQLLLHNICHLNLSAMKNLILWKKTQNSVIKKNLMIALMTQSSQAILLCRISDLSLWQKKKWV